MILMIDEERWRSNSVINYLKKNHGYKVELISDVDEALSYIREKRFRIEAFILDLMMPFGSSFTCEETKGGTLTGYVLLQIIRQELGISVPIIVYTALNKVELFNSLRKEPNTFVLRKGNSSAYDIVVQLRECGVVPQPE